MKKFFLKQERKNEIYLEENKLKKEAIYIQNSNKYISDAQRINGLTIWITIRVSTLAS